MARNNKSKLVKGSVVGVLMLALSGCQTLDDAAIYTVLYGVIDPIAFVGTAGEKIAKPLVADPMEEWVVERKTDGMEAEGIIPEIDRSSDKAGIEKDQNGIRDDVDHFIMAETDVPELTLVLKQIARGLQEIQEV